MPLKPSVSEQVLERAKALPEGTPLTAKGLLELGARPALDQALSRLARQGELIRLTRGVYARPVTGRFGTRAPEPSKVVSELTARLGEIAAPHGAMAANALGFTTQVPTLEIYLTSGRSRRLQLGRQVVELRHVPSWQLLFPTTPAGQLLRAMAWLGPERAETAVREAESQLRPAERSALLNARPRFPSWVAQAVSLIATHG